MSRADRLARRVRYNLWAVLWNMEEPARGPIASRYGQTVGRWQHSPQVGVRTLVKDMVADLAEAALVAG